MMKTPGGFSRQATLKDENGTLSGTFGSQMGEVAITHGRARQKITMGQQTPQGDMIV
jgi:hypothetical protein